MCPWPPNLGRSWASLGQEWLSLEQWQGSQQVFPQRPEPEPIINEARQLPKPPAHSHLTGSSVTGQVHLHCTGWERTKKTAKNFRAELWDSSQTPVEGQAGHLTIAAAGTQSSRAGHLLGTLQRRKGAIIGASVSMA